jgi:hypothetical protein
MAARSAVNRKVAGSSPAGGVIYFTLLLDSGSLVLIVLPETLLCDNLKNSKTPKIPKKVSGKKVLFSVSCLWSIVLHTL